MDMLSTAFSVLVCDVRYRSGMIVATDCMYGFDCLERRMAEIAKILRVD